MKREVVKEVGPWWFLIVLRLDHELDTLTSVLAAATAWQRIGLMNRHDCYLFVQHSYVLHSSISSQKRYNNLT